MLFDCFIFNDEFEMLKLRCEELKELNPVHILVESRQSHTGHAKPLHFQEQQERWAQYNIVAKVFQNIDASSRVRDREQRNFLRDSRIKPEDTVLLCDADEIPRAQAIANWHGNVGMLHMRGNRLYLNAAPHAGHWTSARIASGRMFMSGSPNAMRESGWPENIPDAGWHFSWMGGHERVRTKARFSCEEWVNCDGILDDLDRELADPKVVPIDETFPRYLREHLDEFKHMLFQS